MQRLKIDIEVVLCHDMIISNEHNMQNLNKLRHQLSACLFFHKKWISETRFELYNFIHVMTKVQYLHYSYFTEKWTDISLY